LLTVTVQEAVLPASEVVTVIVANPELTPVTKPLFDTVATAVLLLFHVTFWFVALAGVMVGIRVSVPLTSMAVLALFNDTPVTLTTLALTVTVQESVYPPSTVVTVIAANPALTPVTKPLFDTVATAVLLLLHVTFLFVALVGIIVGKRVSVPLTSMTVLALFNDTPVTLILLVLTVTVQEAVLPPSEVVTIMVAIPALTPVTKPLFDTVATAVLLLLHVTFLFVALAGVMVGIRVSVPLTSMAVLALFNDTPVTGTDLTLPPPGLLPAGLLPPRLVPAGLLHAPNTRANRTNNAIKLRLFLNKNLSLLFIQTSLQ
jgi:cytochrome b561